MKKDGIGFSVFDFAVQFAMGSIGVGIIIFVACIIGIVVFPFIVVAAIIWIAWNIVSNQGIEKSVSPYKGYSY